MHTHQREKYMQMNLQNVEKKGKQAIMQIRTKCMRRKLLNVENRGWQNSVNMTRGTM